MFMHTSCLCFSVFTASVVVVYVCFYYSHCVHIHNKNNCFAGSLATQPLTRTSILRWRHRCWKHLPRQNGRYNLLGVFSSICVDVIVLMIQQIEYVACCRNIKMYTCKFSAHKSIKTAKIKLGDSFRFFFSTNPTPHLISEHGGGKHFSSSSELYESGGEWAA